MVSAVERSRMDWRWAALAGAIYAAGVSLIDSPQAAIVWAAPLALATTLGWIVFAPNNWLPVFFVAALLLPPLPIAFGDSGPHLAAAFAAIGLFAGLLQLAQWRIRADCLLPAFAAFTGVLAASAALAAIYSGVSIAFASLVRVGLFGIGFYIYLYVAHGPWERWPPWRWARFLFTLAVLTALFACLDFYYQFPAPARFGPQFVWLDSGVYRRAQGLFYEASTLGNFCVFFLVMVAVALSRRDRPLSAITLVSGGILLAIALIFSYSRASLLNLGVSLMALAYVRRVRWRRLCALLSAGLAVVAWIAYAVFPSFALSYWTRLVLSLQYFWSSPEGVLSGRLATWRLLIDFAIDHPLTMILGVGYKTLPYSNVAGKPVIADNMYLSMLVEVGIAGFVVFLLWNAAILRAGWRALRSASDEARFYGTWIWCFWIGQIFQMLSGDLLTYWRVLPVYFVVLAVAVRATREDLS
jgi:hypothetical protein